MLNAHSVPCTQAFFVITKIDLAPEHVLRHTLQGLTSILKKPGVRKRAYLVRRVGAEGLGRDRGYLRAPGRLGTLWTGATLPTRPLHTAHGPCASLLRLPLALTRSPHIPSNSPRPPPPPPPPPPPQVRTTDDVLTCARHMHADALAPIFLTSSVTGQVGGCRRAGLSAVDRLGLRAMGSG